jgi:hypothetical protein
MENERQQLRQYASIEIDQSRAADGLVAQPLVGVNCQFEDEDIRIPFSFEGDFDQPVG